MPTLKHVEEIVIGKIIKYTYLMTGTLVIVMLIGNLLVLLVVGTIIL